MRADEHDARQDSPDPQSLHTDQHADQHADQHTDQHTDQHNVLSALYNAMTTHGIAAVRKPLSIEVVQRHETGFTQYEVVPWSADPGVPVLYLTSFEQTMDNGFEVARPMQLAKFRAGVDPYVAQWLTPTEHPLTMAPTWFLHPCRSRDWLEATGGSWWLWLQYFGGAVGLQTVN